MGETVSPPRVRGSYKKAMRELSRKFQEKTAREIICFVKIAEPGYPWTRNSVNKCGIPAAAPAGFIAEITNVTTGAVNETLAKRLSPFGLGVCAKAQTLYILARCL
jgi:hypothetical protein